MTKTRTQLYRPLIAVGLALTCAVALSQSVIVQGSGPGNVQGTGVGNVRGTATPAPTSSNYCDGRFTVWSDSTNVVVDNDSGLTWTRNANLDGTKNWSNAVAYCSNLTYATSSDWRLPSIAELSRDERYGGTTNGLADAYPSTNNPALPLGHPFINVQSYDYWSSTTYTEDTLDAWYAYLANGDVWYDNKISYSAYVWPCRGP